MTKYVTKWEKKERGVVSQGMTIPRQLPEEKIIKRSI